MTRTKLRSVPKPVEKEPDYAGDIYADVRRLAHQPDRWRRLHENSERRERLDIHTPPHRRTWASWARDL